MLVEYWPRLYQYLIGLLKVHHACSEEHLGEAVGGQHVEDSVCCLPHAKYEKDTHREEKGGPTFAKGSFLCWTLQQHFAM